MRTLVVWCPDWPVVAAGLPGGGPVAVVHANRVVACSAGARAEGVRLGLRRREAQSRCPTLAVIAADPARDARAFEPVVAAVEVLTTGVEVLRPGACALPTRGPSRYFGGDAALAARMTTVAGVALEGRGACRVGVADGRFAALLAARRGLVVPAGESAAFLAPLPVRVLDRPDLADLLRRLGLRSLGQVAALAVGDLAGRFGADGVAVHRLASGLDEDPVVARRPPPDLEVATELDPPADRVDVAAFAAKALADELHDRLVAHGLACTVLRIEAETEHGERLVRCWRHEETAALRPARQSPAAAMAERVRWQLDGWLNRPRGDRPTAGLTRLCLSPEQVAPDHGRQIGFWGGTAVAVERAERAVAQVQGLLGPQAVQVAELRGGRGPVEQVRLLPVGAVALGQPTTGVCADRGPWPGRVPPPAPATVHLRPVPAEVLDSYGHPVAVGGRGEVSAAPARLSVAGARWQAVSAWAGPWPADERWWDPATRRRRARFQVVGTDGQAHLLVLEGGRWWVEATYD